MEEAARRSLLMLLDVFRSSKAGVARMLTSTLSLPLFTEAWMLLDEMATEPTAVVRCCVSAFKKMVCVTMGTD
jgi:hypothetical protein